MRAMTTTTTMACKTSSGGGVRTINKPLIAYIVSAAWEKAHLKNSIVSLYHFTEFNLCLPM